MHPSKMMAKKRDRSENIVPGVKRELWKDAPLNEEDDAGSVYQGAYSGLLPAIDSLAKSGPDSSQGALLVYTGGKAIAKQAMGPIRKLSGAALGTNRTRSDLKHRSPSPKISATSLRNSSSNGWYSPSADINTEKTLFHRAELF